MKPVTKEEIVFWIKQEVLQLEQFESPAAGRDNPLVELAEVMGILEELEKEIS